MVIAKQECIGPPDIRSRTRNGPDVTPTQQTTQSECPHNTYLDVSPEGALSHKSWAYSLRLITWSLVVLLTPKWSFSWTFPNGRYQTLRQSLAYYVDYDPKCAS